MFAPRNSSPNQVFNNEDVAAYQVICLSIFFFLRLFSTSDAVFWSGNLVNISNYYFFLSSNNDDLIGNINRRRNILYNVWNNKNKVLNSITNIKKRKRQRFLVIFSFLHTKFQKNVEIILGKRHFFCFCFFESTLIDREFISLSIYKMHQSLEDIGGVCCWVNKYIPIC